jgi:hypothetical protein
MTHGQGEELRKQGQKYFRFESDILALSFTYIPKGEMNNA